MILLIDAYNLLKYQVGHDHVSNSSVARFLKTIQTYADQKKHTIYVVFDGGPTTLRYKERHGSLVTAIYPGVGRCADSEIVQLAALLHHSEALLISSDRVLIQNVSYHDIPHIQVPLFLSYMYSALQPAATFIPHDTQTELIRTTFDKNNPELDALMHAAAADIVHKDGKNEYTIQRDEKPARLPKRHEYSLPIYRKVLSLIKKL